MDIRGFITSGILELYVNGLASPEEVKEVEELAEKHPEIQQEIDAIRQALEQYVLSHQVQPPAGLKAKIMDRIDSAPKPRPVKSKPAATTAVPSSKSYGSDERDAGVNMSAIASWLLAFGMLAAGILAYWFHTQNMQARTALAESQVQYEQFKQACEERQKKDDALREQFIAIRHKSTQPVQMKGTKLAEDALATVYWNNVRRTSYLDVASLPIPPAGKQYQLWAIVDGKPADMGVFEVDANADGLTSVPFIENAQAFAVTLEPEGGSENPTLDQMYVIGTVAKG